MLPAFSVFTALFSSNLRIFATEYEIEGSHRADNVSEWRERLFDTEGTGEGV